MNKFIKKNLKVIIVFLILYITIVTLSFVKVKKDIVVPSSTSTIENIIMIENESKLNGSINVVSVYSYEKISVLSYLLGLINPYADITDNVESNNINYNEQYIGGVIQKQISIYNAIIAGYKAANYDIKSEFIGYYVNTKTLYLDEDLNIGDIIQSINGIELSNALTPKMAIDQIFSDQSSPTFSKDVEMKIIKNYYGGNREVSSITLTPTELSSNGKTYYSFGFSADALNIPKNSEDYPKFEISWDNVSSIGPSGGLLQSFYVYEKLTGAVLSNNLKIAGTGTVDVNGNAGLIGGIKQKIIAAELSGIDIFFVPVTSENYLEDPDEINYQEAMKAYQELKNPHLKLEVVWNLKGIIDVLTDYGRLENE